MVSKGVSDGPSEEKGLISRELEIIVIPIPEFAIIVVIGWSSIISTSWMPRLS